MKKILEKKNDILSDIFKKITEDDVSRISLFDYLKLTRALMYFIIGNLIGRVITFFILFKKFKICFHILNRKTRIEYIGSSNTEKSKENITSKVLFSYKNKYYLVEYYPFPSNNSEKSIHIYELYKRGYEWLIDTKKGDFIPSMSVLNWILLFVIKLTRNKMINLYNKSKDKDKYFNILSIYNQSFTDDTSEQAMLKNTIRKLRISAI